MVVGAGFDVTPVARVARLVRDHRTALDRIFTLQERVYCAGGPARRRDARYAAAFAGKEAVLKALGIGWRSDVHWSEIDTGSIDATGGVRLTGGARRAAEHQGVTRVIVSVTFTSELALAAALAERVAYGWEPDRN
jgi:holo-[acyl-carrier protein] synthase